MATAPKPAPADAATAPASGKAKKIIIAVVALLVVAGIGVAAGMHFLGADGKHKSAEKAEHIAPPIYVILEPLTVNLQPSDEGLEQYLQVSLTAQVGEKEHEEMLKLYMPQIRSRLLLLLSSKKAKEINTEDGKHKLSEEILQTIRKPYSEKGPAQRIMNIFFTSFVIQ